MIEQYLRCVLAVKVLFLPLNTINPEALHIQSNDGFITALTHEPSTPFAVQLSHYSFSRLFPRHIKIGVSCYTISISTAPKWCGPQKPY
ncbi:hypothetical protein OUZ56_005645 [Daphnia magna]|uniref:Secreted protein n=1 Tax=Daphnia magna TaxID=35525 RepID=A0ABQ9YTF9_9CRUS|nr:hypothetical protein OUZ56_005645 [Daphnia magna]